MGAPKGEKNVNWKGGIAGYPNHSELKRNRLLILQQAKGKCKICGEPAQLTHHIDGSVDNHSLDNLVAVCNPCHKALHHKDNKFGGDGKTSKYRRKYGLTLNEMTLRLGGSVGFYSKLKKKGKLGSFLKANCPELN